MEKLEVSVYMTKCLMNQLCHDPKHSVFGQGHFSNKDTNHQTVWHDHEKRSFGKGQ